MTPNEIRKKIEKLIKEKGYNYREVSLMMGKRDAYIHRYVYYGSPLRLKEEDRYKLAQILDCDESELTDRPVNREAFSLKLSPSVANIDMLNVTACCGTGTDVTNEPVIGVWQMPIQDYNAMSLTSPENIKIIKAVGDSMLPTVSDGDYVFVDISNQNITSDGVYVLRLPTGLSIKRIQNGLMGDVTIRSDNPAYAPITASLIDIKILGRVVRIMNVRKI